MRRSQKTPGQLSSQTSHSGQPGPLRPQFSISDPKVPTSPTEFTKHAPGVWSRLRRQIALDRMIGRLPIFLTLTSMIRSIRDSDSLSTNSYTILVVRETTHLELAPIQRSEHIELGYRRIGINPFDCHTIMKFESEHTVLLGMTRDQIKILPPHHGPCAGSSWIA
ncbi:hypothetical protein L3X38_024562 [Prunus dulcis]|uniref:Uncharacterized protein n=1 Tax=Prunus dulcis TaxID=3755 RepID=A0AAD4W1N4_PRUDU|nr:hypothetical protein L3X38_024562 [Prunus dulcis]